jgi:TolB-like protein/Flp pilus assembly protein TadD
MPPASDRAVFLSYASQDAEAARRICEALRAVGVEVWFDQNELVGGDAWDAKIRKQIAECALFVPIISAATQARLEGYFRIEWKLAARRTHGIATAKAFLLPLVIDATRDAEAHVPDEFREVQWTRLPGGETSEKFCARVSQLLSEGVAPQPGRETPERGPLRRVTPKSSGWIVPAVIAAAGVIALVLWSRWKKSPVAQSPSATSAPATAAPKSGAETAAGLAEQARSNYYPFSTPASLQLADEFSKRATELDPHDAKAWGTRANASARYLLRSFVSGEAAQQRARDAQSFANRALSLDKNETEALTALGIVAAHQHAQAQAETLFRRVLAVEPGNVQAPSLLSMVLRENGRNAEAVVVMKRAVAGSPRDPILHLFLGFAFWADWNFAKAAEQFDAAATVADFQNPRVYQAWVVFLQTGDLARLRSMLESVDLVYSSDDSKLTYLLTCGLFERRADRVLEAVGRTTSAYFDGEAMPKAWFSALAYEIDHKDNLARQQWLAAETVIRERLRADPQSELLRMDLAITLAKLGRTADARAEFDPVEAVWREQPGVVKNIWLARFYAVTGDARNAVASLRQSLNRLSVDPETFKGATSLTIPLDPWWDPIRGSAEFRELVAHPPEPPAPVDDEPEKKPSAAETKTDGKSAAADKSIAVLPFVNMGADKADEYLGDGMTEELLNALAKVKGLRVPGRSSSFAFKGRTGDDIFRQVGEKLHVSTVLEGSVRKVGDKIRITAQLINCVDGNHLWSEQYDRNMTDLLALQTEVAQQVTQKLQIELGVAETRALTKTATKNPEAHRLYLLGRFHFAKLTDAGFAEAAKYYNEALRIDPDYALPYCGLADNYGFFGSVSMSGREAWPKEKELAEKALALDPNLAEAHFSLGLALADMFDWPGAEREMRRALELNPNYGLAHDQYAWVLLTHGRFDEALAEERKALELDPLSPLFNGSYAEWLTYARRWDEAYAQALRARELDSNFRGSTLARILYFKGDIAGAIAEYQSQTGRSPRDRTLAFAYVRAGERAKAEQILRDLDDGAKRSYVSPAERAYVYLALGEKEKALDWLERSYEEQDLECSMLKVEPTLDPLRGEPRFQALMKKVGLVL